MPINVSDVQCALVRESSWEHGVSDFIIESWYTHFGVNLTEGLKLGFVFKTIKVITRIIIMISIITLESFKIFITS